MRIKSQFWGKLKKNYPDFLAKINLSQYTLDRFICSNFSRQCIHLQSFNTVFEYINLLYFFKLTKFQIKNNSQIITYQKWLFKWTIKKSWPKFPNIQKEVFILKNKSASKNIFKFKRLFLKDKSRQRKISKRAAMLQ